MVIQQRGGYSKYIRPLNVFFDLLTISIFSLYFFRNQNIDLLYYLTYQTSSWIIIAILVKYYEVYRFTTPVEIATKLLKQFAVFLLVIIAFL